MTWTPISALGSAAALIATLGLAAGCDDTEAQPCDTASGVVCTWAGNGEEAFDGDGNPLLESSFYWPISMAFTSQGTYILDWNNHRVREVTAEGTLETVIGNDFIGDGPDDQSDLTLPGAPGTSVTLNHPTQIVEMPDGKLILLAWHNHKLRQYDPETGLVYVLCGGSAGFGGDGGPAKEAKLNQPQAAAVAPDGALYILDQRNQVIRKIAADGMISTVAGTPGEAGFEGDGGDALLAKFDFPAGSNPPPAGGVALDGDRLYVADTLNHRVRVVDLTTGTIDTVAGNGTAGFSGDGGPGTEAQLNNPRNLAIGPDGKLYIGDELNNRIRALDIASGVLTTAVGTGEAADGADGLRPTETALHRPSGVVFSPEGDMYVLDTYNNRIRRIAAGHY